MKITIERQKVYAHHGVLPQEQVIGANFYVTTEIETDFTESMATDRLEDTISYADIARIVTEEMHINSKLLEHVVGRIAKRILQEFSTAKVVTIRLTKENPPMGVECEGATIELTLSRC